MLGAGFSSLFVKPMGARGLFEAGLLATAETRRRANAEHDSHEAAEQANGYERWSDQA